MSIKKRRALVVGINKYPEPAALEGCVNDAMGWGEYLHKKKRFEVHYLFDEEATREAILFELNQLSTASKPQDILTFIYSGHGTNVRDLDGDEEDARDEALVPVDYRSGALIIDDDLRAIFDKINPEVTLTVFLDSCYSGTATRVLGVNANRMEIGSKTGKYIRLGKETHEKYRQHRENYIEVINKSKPSPDLMNHATISACTPQEVAYEHDGQGDFSRAALAVLPKAGTALTLGGFLKRVITEMGENRWQTPTFDGPLHMLKRTIVRKNAR